MLAAFDMRLRLGSFPFVWVILGCGGICFLFIVGNLLFLGLHRYPTEPRLYVNGGDKQRGRNAIVRYGCEGCHVIPGVGNAKGRVGPRLEDLKMQSFIAGKLVNSPENLVNWIKHPQEISPNTAMPDLNVTEQDARDIAEYLYKASEFGCIKIN